jgi:phenylacetate-CoA ligase
VLDDYTRGYIEKAFGCRLFDVYGSTEAGPVAFECQQGRYHVHADFVAVEVVDEQGQGVPRGSPGRVVVTKLYGRGTPVIRYTGMNDVVTLLKGECDCGLSGPVLGEIGGRRVDAVVLPDGRLVPPSSFTGIPGKVMHELGTDKIVQFQIVQHTRDTIEILVVIDEELRNTGPSVEVIFGEIKQRYHKIWGENITITIKEVKAIKKEKNLQTPPRVVISKVKYE